MTTSRALEFYERAKKNEVERVSKGSKEVDGKTILVLYRRSAPQNFKAGKDHWMFLDLDSAHYGLCGFALDCIMLMDGITKIEVITCPAWVAILPNMKPDAVVMEAG